jgi:myo-inositol-1(or 4)-monophosphatase
MKFDKHDLTLAEQLVKAAAREELMPRFRKVSSTVKADGSLITEADLAVHKRLHNELQAYWPEAEFLSEEMPESEQLDLLAQADRAMWCLDPLDGTSNYAAGIPYFGVSLALMKAGRCVAGVVYDPVANECFSAISGQGARLNGETLAPEQRPVDLKSSMAMIDLKRLPVELIESFAHRAPYRSQRSFGSVALDWCWIGAGRCHVYLHGGQKLWDYAAGSLIALEAGAAGGLMDGYTEEFSQVLTLKPRIGMAATDEALLGLWRGWISMELKKSHRGNTRSSGQEKCPD